MVALSNKLFFGRLVYAVCPISLKHKRQTTFGNTNVTKDKQHVLVPKRDKEYVHMCYHEKKIHSVCFPSKGK